MHFGFDQDQELLRSSTRRFLEDRHPVSRTRVEMEEPFALDRATWRAGAGIGWTALLIGEEHGGGSVTHQPLVDLVAVAEELGRQLYPGPVLPTSLVAAALGRLGTPTQQAAHLPGIAAGETVGAWCFTADGTADPSAVEVQARTDGGSVVLRGTARFVQGAESADLLLVTARTVEGLSLVLVPRPAEGVRVRRLGTLDLTRSFCEVGLEDVEVPADAVLGNLGEAQPVVDELLRLGTILQAAEIVGAAESLFERTVEYTKTRVQFGRTIGSFQAVKHRLADLLVLLEGLRAASRYAALAVADERDDRDEAVAVAGSYVREAYAEICSQSLQLHGGMGFTWEHDVHLFLRRAKVDGVLLGTPTWHRDRLYTQLETLVEAR